MIDSLRPGKITHLPRGLLVQIGPVSLRVRCPQPDAIEISAAGFLETVLRLSDEQLILYGFASDQRRQLFLDLCSLKGIGPESALSVLDLGETIDILRAVSAQESTFFSVIPGLGASRVSTIISLLSGKYRLPEPLPVSVSSWTAAKARHPDIDFEALLDDPEVDLLDELNKNLL